ncbi:hypothetical protein HMPREF9441_01712 [Paraprevotella clara YIT 11840]|uniref:Uncharacterized protein n=1 Tax=Paraprevotella clara YIT 11840 TaxID=762968 RepID=G5SQS2_9BACT|nr:hypothetical protein HMPREF9441_01712 [Paraprevotella clara YIT 11840]
MAHSGLTAAAPQTHRSADCAALCCAAVRGVQPRCLILKPMN